MELKKNIQEEIKFIEDYAMVPRIGAIGEYRDGYKAALEWVLSVLPSPPKE